MGLFSGIKNLFKKKDRSSEYKASFSEASGSQDAPFRIKPDENPLTIESLVRRTEGQFPAFVKGDYKFYMFAGPLVEGNNEEYNKLESLANDGEGGFGQTRKKYGVRVVFVGVKEGSTDYVVFKAIGRKNVGREDGFDGYSAPLPADNQERPIKSDEDLKGWIKETTPKLVIKDKQKMLEESEPGKSLNYLRGRIESENYGFMQAAVGETTNIENRGFFLADLAIGLIEQKESKQKKSAADTNNRASEGQIAAPQPEQNSSSAVSIQESAQKGMPRSSMEESRRGANPSATHSLPPMPKRSSSIPERLDDRGREGVAAVADVFRGLRGVGGSTTLNIPPVAMPSKGNTNVSSLNTGADPSFDPIVPPSNGFGSISGVGSSAMAAGNSLLGGINPTDIDIEFHDDDDDEEHIPLVGNRNGSGITNNAPKEQYISSAQLSQREPTVVVSTTNTSVERDNFSPLTEVNASTGNPRILSQRSDDYRLTDPESSVIEGSGESDEITGGPIKTQLAGARGRNSIRIPPNADGSFDSGVEAAPLLGPLQSDEVVDLSGVDVRVQDSAGAGRSSDLPPLLSFPAGGSGVKNANRVGALGPVGSGSSSLSQRTRGFEPLLVPGADSAPPPSAAEDEEESSDDAPIDLSSILADINSPEAIEFKRKVNRKAFLESDALITLSQRISDGINQYLGFATGSNVSAADPEQATREAKAALLDLLNSSEVKNVSHETFQYLAEVSKAVLEDTSPDIEDEKRQEFLENIGKTFQIVGEQSISRNIEAYFEIIKGTNDDAKTLFGEDEDRGLTKKIKELGENSLKHIIGEVEKESSKDAKQEDEKDKEKDSLKKPEKNKIKEVAIIGLKAAITIGLLFAGPVGPILAIAFLFISRNWGHGDPEKDKKEMEEFQEKLKQQVKGEAREKLVEQMKKLREEYRKKAEEDKNKDKQEVPDNSVDHDEEEENDVAGDPNEEELSRKGTRPAEVGVTGIPEVAPPSLTTAAPIDPFLAPQLPPPPPHVVTGQGQHPLDRDSDAAGAFNNAEWAAVVPSNTSQQSQNHPAGYVPDAPIIPGSRAPRSGIEV